AVLLHHRVHRVGEVRRRGRVVDRHGALLAADRDDDLLAGGLLGADVGLELGDGVAVQAGRVQVEGDGAGRARGVREGDRDDVVLVLHVRDALHGGAVVEVLPVAGHRVPGQVTAPAAV